MRHIGSVFGRGAPLSEAVGADSFSRYVGDRLILDFHEGAGTTVRDLSNNGNDGTLTNPSDLTWQHNKLVIGSTNGYINCGQKATLNLTENVTLEAFFEYTWNGSRQVIITKGYNVWYYTLRVEDSAKVSGYLYSGAAWVLVEDLLPLPLVKHTASTIVTWNTNTKDYRLYVQGSLRKEDTEAGFGIGDNAIHDLYIGANRGIVPFDSPISFIRINATAFSANQILAEYLWNKWRN